MVFDESDVVFRYTEEQAVEDGILFDLAQLHQQWAEKGLFSHITTNLLEKKGYLRKNQETGKDELNVPCVVDLLNTCLQIVKDGRKKDPEETRMFTGKAESPDGEQFTVWCVANGLHRFTILLPEDN